MEYWRGRRIVPTNAAYRELHDQRISMRGVVEVLESGHEPVDRRRAKGIFERCLQHGNESIKVVVAESYQHWSNEFVWLVVHVKRVKT